MDFAHLVHPGILSRTRRLVRWPALHFLLLGGLLLAADAAWSRLGASLGSRTIVLTAADVSALRLSFQQQYGRVPRAAEERTLVDRAIDDEVLYRRALEIGLDRQNRVVRERLVATMRLLADDSKKDEETLYHEALALGLDKRDVVVRRHLVQLMALLLKRSGAKSDVGEAELQRALERDADRYRLPGQLTLTHVYFDPVRRGAHLEADAARVLADARAGRVIPADAPALGDPFLLGSRFSKRSDRELRKLLGDRFADAAARATPGQWSEPVRSAYGLHLLLVEERVAGQLPPIESVRNQLVGRLLEERGEEALKTKLAEMRSRYAIRIEPSAGAPRAASAGDAGTVLAVPRPARELGD
jgi:peptidyl-prolyl cis-trans isomerase C